MRCSNCHREIPDAAKACQYCEAKVQPPPAEEGVAAAEEAIGQGRGESLEALNETVSGSETVEELASAIMVGRCPVCDSDETGDCAGEAEFDHNPFLAECHNCGQLWCIPCGKLLEGSVPHCDCWEDGR